MPCCSLPAPAPKWPLIQPYRLPLQVVGPYWNAGAVPPAGLLGAVFSLPARDPSPALCDSYRRGVCPLCNFLPPSYPFPSLALLTTRSSNTKADARCSSWLRNIPPFPSTQREQLEGSLFSELLEPRIPQKMQTPVQL